MAGQAVSDAVFGAEPMEGVMAGGFVLGFAFFVDGEAVGEFGAVVGKAGAPRRP
jgi:hypothetical protein